MKLSEDNAEAGVVHFWEFEFVFFEVVPPLRHSVVDADVIEEDDSARTHEGAVER